MAKTIAIVNQKGGVAKTTTVVNLSAYLAKAGKKVLVIDIDPQGNATSGLGIDRDHLELCIYDVLINDISMAGVIQPTEVESLSVLPATISLAGAEIELVSSANREQKLKNALEEE